MKKVDVWKLQDAKARFSEVVRKARAGAPQKVTLHGKDAVLVVDAERYEIKLRPQHRRTMVDFIAGSKKFKGILEGVNLERPTGDIGPRGIVFDEDET